jgi:hypothetical protein
VNSIYDELSSTGTLGSKATARPAMQDEGRTLRWGQPRKRRRFKKRTNLRSRFVEWFWNLRQGCDKVAEGRSF